MPSSNRCTRSSRIFGRRYVLIEEFMTADAEVVFFMQGGRGDRALRSSMRGGRESDRAAPATHFRPTA
jgi:hypothetical protein